jgi:hypothetical protein
MKLHLIIIVSFLCVLSVHSQNYVFVLVDVSKSITKDQLSDAKQALTEVLTGSALTKAFVAQGKPQDLTNFKIMQDDKLAIVKFGSLQTTLAINPNPTLIQNASVDISQVINSSSWTPTDLQTYITLAKAKIAEYAINHQIAKYKLYLISDNVQDDYGPGGKPNYPDDYTRNLAEGYNTSMNQVNEAGYTKIKFGASSLFTLSFSPNVDISKYSLPVGTPPSGTTDDIISTPTIVLTAFANGKKDKPKETNSNSFSITWSCSCPAGSIFNVLLTQVDGGTYKQKKSSTANSVKFDDVPSGKFKIVVSTPNANSAITFVETPANNFLLILLLLLIIVTGLVVYKVWNDKRKKKPAKSMDEKVKEIFSTGNSNSPQSTNTKHY